MTKSECFEFTDWVSKYYRRLSENLYIGKLERLSETNYGKTLNELFEIWRMK